MADAKEITKALAAHGMWKSRLLQAVQTGKTEVPVATIQVDNQCEFGKWLYGATFSANDRSAPIYAKVKDLHAQFHRVAAKVAQLATTGKKADAEKMMGLSGEYSEVSSKLTLALMEWQKSLK